MTDRYPVVLARRRRQAWWRLALLAVVLVLGYRDDLRKAESYGVAETPAERVVTGVVVGHGNERVRYRHPATGQDVRATFAVWSAPRPRVGDSVKLVVGADPLVVELAGDSFGPSENASVYMVLAGLMIVAATPWWTARRAVSLRSGPSVPAAMVGVISRRRVGLRRTLLLDLYDPAARPGATSVACVPILTCAPVGLDTPFAVQVHGHRVRGLLVASAGSSVLWPRRRRLLRARVRRPVGAAAVPGSWPDVLAPTEPPRVSKRVLVAPLVSVLVAAALGLWVAVATGRNADDSERFI